ncbi:phosphatase PAP2 family protein [Streptomyces sp. TLI_105]|uniref:phosphatase PAP2 family protein n=1 Tax=Streptomyces sp. TLI_105 TaxID=1881019 RepID=UPI00089B4BEF|nr:phosphatase PAP2 family protein [Streptomyces sp. TLI_105]SEC25900.1 undecaprenyl-diphosphatase [Streptomyces sp. TLI_105]
MRRGRVKGASAAVVWPSAVRVGLGGIAGLAAVVVAALGVLYAGDGQPGVVDARVWTVVGGVASPWRDVALGLDFLGEPVGAAALVLAAVIGCLLLRWPRAAVLLGVGVGVAVGVARLLKFLVGRTIHGDNLSFPSGHTAFLTAFAVVVALLLAGRLGLGRTVGVLFVFTAALVAGTAMGWAQVVLGAHYPTDALGGWCTALAVVPAVAWGVDRVVDSGR